MKSRNTIQRQLVLEVVRTLQSHPSAEQVYREICKNHPDISRATVYRNLELLVQRGEITKVKALSSPALFDHITKPHYHIRCRGCGRYFDMEMTTAEGLEKGIKDKNGFDIEGYDIIFFGLCPECKQPSPNNATKEKYDKND